MEMVVTFSQLPVVRPARVRTAKMSEIGLFAQNTMIERCMRGDNVFDQPFPPYADTGITVGITTPRKQIWKKVKGVLVRKNSRERFSISEGKIREGVHKRKIVQYYRGSEIRKIDTLAQRKKFYAENPHLKKAVEKAFGPPKRTKLQAKSLVNLKQYKGAVLIGRSKGRARFQNYSQMKQMLGYPPYRNLRLTGKMFAGMLPQVESVDKVQIGFFWDPTQVGKANRNQSISPWFGLSPSDKEKVSQFVKNLFGSGQIVVDVFS
jgi:hypothetical protein